MHGNMIFSALAALACATLASPVEIVADAAVIERAASPTITSKPSKITDNAQLDSSMDEIATDISALSAGATAIAAIFTEIVPLPGPSSIPQLQAELQKIFSANPENFFKSGAEILMNGLAGDDLLGIAEGYLLESSTNNINLLPVVPPVYPQADPADAPYSTSESDLRKAINIPLDFSYGKRVPVLFLPGTAALAGQNFAPNFAKLFRKNKVADPIFVNIPNENLGDIQIAAEYTAYAINYIAGLAKRPVATLSWSAGSLDSQWAFKYWPSTRKNAQDAIRISADIHGTTLARILCPGFETPGCTPAIAQQYYNSTFIKTLRNNGGDSAYVPTTSIYSIFDEIVQPQEDPNASAATLDARGVGVEDVELQRQCTAFLPGGVLYNSHEGVLYNALAYALAVDAIQNPGPGRLSRVNVSAECQKFAADGLSLADIFATEALIPLAAVNVIAFQPKTDTEPPIKAYAAKDTPSS